MGLYIIRRVPGTRRLRGENAFLDILGSQMVSERPISHIANIDRNDNVENLEK